jgi:hypothetical protein
MSSSPILRVLGLDLRRTVDHHAPVGPPPGPDHRVDLPSRVGLHVLARCLADGGDMLAIYGFTFEYAQPWESELISSSAPVAQPS